ncbi:MAG TPA: DUF1801 domain-containing protein [Trueperaceae bacterium]|nr:DUF1801 domain-containing protein [Trueperaceae bacterium]
MRGSRSVGIDIRRINQVHVNLRAHGEATRFCSQNGQLPERTEVMREKATSIDEYLGGINPAFRPELERIRALVTGLAPNVEEAMSYSMPTLKYKNRALVYFTASKKHMSLYPSSWAIEEFKDRLADYKTSEHAIQFTLEKPLPGELIEDLVRFHIREIDADRK